MNDGVAAWLGKEKQNCLKAPAIVLSGRSRSPSARDDDDDDDDSEWQDNTVIR